MPRAVCREVGGCQIEKPRAATLEEVAREYAKVQQLDLRDRLLLSHFINDAKERLRAGT